MTYIEALNNGYKTLDMKLFRGYISRKINKDNQPVKKAGGNRKGQYYIEIPNWNSTRYSYRLYLTK